MIKILVIILLIIFILISHLSLFLCSDQKLTKYGLTCPETDKELSL